MRERCHLLSLAILEPFAGRHLRMIRFSVPTHQSRTWVFPPKKCLLPSLLGAISPRPSPVCCLLSNCRGIDDILSIGLCPRPAATPLVPGLDPVLPPTRRGARGAWWKPADIDREGDWQDILTGTPRATGLTLAAVSTILAKVGIWSSEAVGR